MILCSASLPQLLPVGKLIILSACISPASQYLAAFDDVIEHLRSKVFQHHDYVCRSGYDLVQLNDVRVPEQFKVLYFPADTVHHVHGRDPASVDDLHGHLVSREGVHGN